MGRPPAYRAALATTCGAQGEGFSASAVAVAVEPLRAGAGRLAVVGEDLGSSFTMRRT